MTEKGASRSARPLFFRLHLTTAEETRNDQPDAFICSALDDRRSLGSRLCGGLGTAPCVVSVVHVLFLDILDRLYSVCRRGPVALGGPAEAALPDTADGKGGAPSSPAIWRFRHGSADHCRGTPGRAAQSAASSAQAALKTPLISS